MCLVSSNPIEIKTAEKDIEVLKAFLKGLLQVEDKLYSCIRNFEYTSGLQEEIEIKPQYGPARAFTQQAWAINCPAFRLQEDVYYVAEGYHSILFGSPLFEEKGNYFNFYSFVPCIIPKGSKYATCQAELCVSSNIVIPEKPAVINLYN